MEKAGEQMKLALEAARDAALDAEYRDRYSYTLLINHGEVPAWQHHDWPRLPRIDVTNDSDPRAALIDLGGEG